MLEDGVIVAVRLGSGDPPVIDVCRALASGGLRVLEVTLTTPGAVDAIRHLSSRPDLLVGAGTVLTTADVERVGASGACFALSPVCDAEVLRACDASGLLAIPGAATPGEILAAHRLGASLVKVFPSGPLGGPAYLRAVRGPLPDIGLIPTSGPTASSLGEYLDAGAVAVGVGGPALFAPGFDLADLTDSARSIRRAMDEWRKQM